jgi:putative transposase
MGKGSDMKNRQYPEEKIVAILKEATQMGNAAEVCRKYGVSQSTNFRWKQKYSGMEVSEVTRLKEMEAENASLHRLFSRQALEIDGLKEVLGKKW